MSSKALTEHEATRLQKLEGVIQRGQQTFIEVGRALAEIRDSKLYEETHKTFEAYCKEKWDWSRPRAYQFIDAAKTVAALSTVVDIPALPISQTSVPWSDKDWEHSTGLSERQIRPLSKLKSTEEKRKAWFRAVEIAEEEQKPVTGEIVKRAVQEIAPTRQQQNKRLDGIAQHAAAIGNAELAISRLREIDLTSEGAAAAFEKVINYCRGQLEEINNAR